MFNFTKIEVLAGAAVVDTEDIEAGCLEVTRGVVTLANEQLSFSAVVQGLVQRGDCHEPARWWYNVSLLVSNLPTVLQENWYYGDTLLEHARWWYKVSL